MSKKSFKTAKYITNLSNDFLKFIYTNRNLSSEEFHILLQARILSYEPSDIASLLHVF